MNLLKILSQHEQLRFPEFPNDNGFANWVTDLIEVDAYYVGLAKHCVNGGRIKTINFKFYDDLKKNLLKYSNIVEDRDVYVACCRYLDSLGVIVDVLKS